MRYLHLEVGNGVRNLDLIKFRKFIYSVTGKKRQVDRVCSEAMKTDWVSYLF